MDNLEFDVNIMPDLTAMQNELNLADEIHCDEVEELKSENLELQKLIGRQLKIIMKQNEELKQYREGR